MPYIVTTKRRCDQPACDRVEPCSAERSGWCAHPNAEDGLDYRTPVSRRAVATLEEAQAEARHVVLSFYGARRLGSTGQLLLQVARSLPESGGTVGPLPGGTVIEVEEFTSQDFRERHDLWYPTDAENVDAYNAAQQERA